MCRILLALGNVHLPDLFAAMKQIALDQTTIHERNEKTGLGTWLHQDGWGLSIIKDDHFQITKSTKPIFDDPLTTTIGSPKTDFVLLHVRAASVGSVCLKNTHPFHYRTEQGEEIVFCHNGTIKENIKFDQKYKPQGTTDSEQILYSTLTQYQQTNDFSSAIINVFTQLQQPVNSNIIFSTKKKSYIFSKPNQFPRYLQMWIGKKKDALIVSSEKITTIKEYIWEEMPKGKVVVIDHKTLKVTIQP